jgi:hypothetical protein
MLCGWPSAAQPKTPGRRLRRAVQCRARMWIKIPSGEKTRWGTEPAPHRGGSSEIVLRSNLEPACVSDDAGRLPEVGCGPVTGIVAPKVVVIERVEQIERYAE